MVALLFAAMSVPARAAEHIPRQTPTTLARRTLDVVGFPLLPTAQPLSPLEFRSLRRRQDANTVCGFIGGDAALPATCSAGSHCVLDTEHGVVGCCPNGQAACTTGIFTGCVDGNSGPQTAVDPYVFTCQGGDVCYRNQFEGGFSQWGCGTASDLGTTVAETAAGLTSSLELTSESVSFTVTPATTSTDSSSSASTSSTASSLLAISPASATSTTPASPSTSGGPGGGPTINRTGAIIGGSISGGAVVIALVAALIFFWRRRRGNTRQGSGPRGGDTQHIRYVATGPHQREAAETVRGEELTKLTSTSHMSRGGQAFKGVPTSEDGADLALRPDRDFYHVAITAGGSPPPQLAMTQLYSQNPYSVPEYHEEWPLAYVSAEDPVPDYLGGSAGMAGADGQLDADCVPLPREIDDFSRRFQDALERICEEEDDEEISGGGGGGPGGNGSGSGGEVAGGAAAESGESAMPLWQQARRQSRNLMWM